MSAPITPETRALLARCMSQIELEWGAPDLELREVLGVPLDAPIGTKPPEPSGQTLLPCPFCGAVGPASLEIREEELGAFFITCHGCGIEQGMVRASEEEAIAAWNRRHPTDALRRGITINEVRVAQGLPPLSDDTPATADSEREITLTESRGFLWWRRDVQTTYRGSGTVWRDAASGRRADTATEALLADMAWLEAAC